MVFGFAVPTQMGLSAKGADRDPLGTIMNLWKSPAEESRLPVAEQAGQLEGAKVREDTSRLPPLQTLATLSPVGPASKLPRAALVAWVRGSYSVVPS